MSLNLQIPEKTTLKPKIAVFGVGGAGGNAVNNMISSDLKGVEFVVANTDAQALESSFSEKRIHLGYDVTKGLGAGSSPDVGRQAAEESSDQIKQALQGFNMVFITAGMGGGTGTGAAPVVAKIAKEMEILTVGVVTKPFNFEGVRRMKIAESGLEQMQQFVDTLIVIPNQNLFRIANENTTFADAFRMADDVLHSGVRGVTDLMIMPGLINLDFADIRTVMREMGKAMMGTGQAEGERRALQAAEAAISNPLLDNVSMKGARGVLISITGGSDLTLFEVDEAANRIREEVDENANIIFGSTFNDELDGKIRVSVVATGIDAKSNFSNIGGNAQVSSERRAEPEKQMAKQVEPSHNPSVNKAFEQIKKEVNIEGSNPEMGDEYYQVIKKLNAEYESGEVSSEEWNKESGNKGDVFVAPKPKSAESDFNESQMKENNSYQSSGSHEQQYEANEVNQGVSKSGGLFKRMAKGVAKSLQGSERRGQEEARESVVESVGAQAGEGQSKDYHDDLLDVPAFLRRK